MDGTARTSGLGAGVADRGGEIDRISGDGARTAAGDGTETGAGAFVEAELLPGLDVLLCGRLGRGPAGGGAAAPVVTMLRPTSTSGISGIILNGLASLEGVATGMLEGCV